MRLSSIMLALLIGLSGTAWTSAMALTIDVYSTAPGRSSQIDGVMVRHHKVDQVLELERQISEGLPADEARARQILASRVTPEFERQIKQAWDAVARVRTLKIKYLPAIVFDQSYVYYGHDLRRAKNMYDVYIREALK